MKPMQLCPFVLLVSLLGNVSELYADGICREIDCSFDGCHCIEATGSRVLILATGAPASFCLENGFLITFVLTRSAKKWKDNTNLSDKIRKSVNFKVVYCANVLVSFNHIKQFLPYLAPLGLPEVSAYTRSGFLSNAANTSKSGSKMKRHQQQFTDHQVTHSATLSSGGCRHGISGVIIVHFPAPWFLRI
ncbi:hypothetical protein Bca4012_019569 [Brassica carinata]